MRIFITLLLGLCTLSITVNASKRPWKTTNSSWAVSRSARAVNRPAPIDCRLGSWSSWTPCNSCTDKKFRFRYMEKPSQFDGTECFETLWDRLLCPTATTQCLVPDYCGDSFTCKETGRCISQSLRCDGEADCEDFSDEDDCEVLNQREDKCSTLMPIPGAERGTQGYNILTGDFVDHVLDPKYFGGKCEYVYNGEWRKFIYDSFCESLHYNEDEKNYRKPYNYHTYQFVAEAKSEGSQEYYDDMISLLEARKTMSSSRGGASIGVYNVEVGLSGSSERTFESNLTRYKNEDVGFVRLLSKVQTADFKMRSNKLMLDENFYMSLMELPEQYDFGMYSSFIKTFGTHYVTEGSMGGTLEYIMVINKTATSNSKREGQESGHCFGASIGLNFPITDSFSIGPKGGLNSCNKGGSYEAGKSSHSSTVIDTVTQVKGGILGSSSGVMAIRNPETYKKWGASLQYNPTIIDYEIMPIYELVRLSTAADHVGSRLANLQRSWDEYLQQFDSCRCAPCRNNGVPVLTGTSCSCLCKSGYEGKACEKTQREDTGTDGSWSCWGAWSTCTSGRKTRTRACNNPPRAGRGVNCLGSSSQTQQC